MRPWTSLPRGHEEGPLGLQTTLARGGAEATWGREGSRGRRGEGRRQRGARQGRSDQRTLQDGGGGRRRGDGWRLRELTKRRGPAQLGSRRKGGELATSGLAMTEDKEERKMSFFWLGGQRNKR